MVEDPSYSDGVAWLLAENELDGAFTKWNNNGGDVKKSRSAHTNGTPDGNGGAVSGDSSTTDAEQWAEIRTLDLLDSIIEEEDEEEDADGSDEARHGQFVSLEKRRREMREQVDKDCIPQAFSHFTFEATDGTKLVCDLQGVWNSVDGFTFTDPVIHCREDGGTKTHMNGATDKGTEGIASFFKTHECNEICKRLGLPERRSGGMVDLTRAEVPPTCRACAA